MPLYNPSPLAAAPVLLMAGTPEYLLGRRYVYTSDTRMYLSAVTDNGTTAVYTGQIVDGNIPIVGALFSAQTNTAQSPVNAAISAVSFNTAGLGTVTIPSVGATSGPISGVGIVPVPEVPETLVNNSFSIPALVPLTGGATISRLMFAEVTFPTIPTAATVFIQAAIRNIPTEYVNLVQVGTVTGGAIGLSQAYFQGQGMYYRFAVTGVTGTGTIAGKIVV